MPNKKILVDYNFNQNELQNAVDQNLATAPSNPKEGQFYWDTTNKEDMIYNGSTWISRTTQGKTYTAGTGIDISGTTIAVDFDDVATAAQGGLADTAIQPNDNVSDLTNDAGYITGITSSDVTTALGYTPYNSTNPSGYQANVIESIKVNGTAQTITSKSVNLKDTIRFLTESVQSIKMPGGKWGLAIFD